MHKTCKNCGVANAEHARFCTKCGEPLHSSGSAESNAKERTPADQAAEITEKTKAKAEEVWRNFGTGEKIIAIGAIAAIIAFFLPWVSVSGQSTNGITAGNTTGYVYILPISMIISLILLYFSQGATEKNKILVARWQIVIGTVWASNTVLSIFAIDSIMGAIQKAMGGFGALFGASSSISASIGIGMYLFAAGSIAVAVGAFRVQSELVRHKRKIE